MNKKILIIGSKGFIGSHCTRFFNTRGMDVYECDVLPEYKFDRYYWLNATNSNFDSIFEKMQFEVCINCSGAANVGFSFERPSVDFELNSGNVYKILTAIKNTQTRCKFINLSSAAVYGEPSSLPIVEIASIKPISPYGMHKQYAELICGEFHDHFGIDVCSLRIFSAYGPGLKKQLFWDLHKKALLGEKVQLFGDGSESRDFISIHDLLSMIEILIAYSKFEYQILNAANGIEVSIKEAVDIFFDLYPGEIDYSFDIERRKGDPSNWVADISRIERLGYKQGVSLEEGLSEYIEWARKERI